MTALHEPESARSALNSILLSSAQNPRILYYTYVGLGVLLGRLGLHEESMKAYGNAGRQHPGPPGVMNWFALACALGSKADALEAATALDSLPPKACIPIPMKNDRRPRVSVRKFLARIDDRLGDNSGKIADALLQDE